MSKLNLGQLRPLQAMAASLLFRKRRIIVIMPRQKGGKTELGVRLAHDLTLQPETSSSLFLAKSKTAGKKAVREKFMRLFDKEIFTVNTEIAYLKACPTSAVFMESVDKDPDRIRGGTYYFIHWSEVAFSKFEHGQTVTDVFDKVINPTLSETDGYVYLESTTNGKNGFWDLCENAEMLGFTLLKVSLSDMVYLGLVAPTEYDRIKSTTQPDVFDQEFECNFVSFQGRIYPEFREETHVIKDMPGPEGWQTVVLAIDWGYSPSATCVLFAYIKDGELWVFDEHYALKELAVHTGDAIDSKLAHWNVRQYTAVADHEPDRIEELNRRGISCGLADKVNVQGNRIQVKELMYYNKYKVASRCTFLRRDLLAAVWHPTKEGEIDETQCTWGHFDAESTNRYLVRAFADMVDFKPKENPLHAIDPLSAAALMEDQKRRLRLI